MDDQEIIRAVLGKQHGVFVAGSVEESERILARENIDLILLDIVLPDGDGFRYCATLQTKDETRQIPIIFLTVKNNVQDKVLGFSLGADDYISKPFDPIELRARVESRLKKNRERSERELVLQKGDVSFDIPRQRIQVQSNGRSQEVELTPLEFKLLLFFARHEGHVLSRGQLIAGVWGDHTHVIDRNVDTQVSGLRKKIAASVYSIQSVHGMGYRFDKERG